MHLRYSTLVVSQLFIESVPWDIFGQYEDKIRILVSKSLELLHREAFSKRIDGTGRLRQVGTGKIGLSKR